MHNVSYSFFSGVEHVHKILEETKVKSTDGDTEHKRRYEETVGKYDKILLEKNSEIQTLTEKLRDAEQDKQLVLQNMHNTHTNAHTHSHISEESSGTKNKILSFPICHILPY